MIQYLLLILAMSMNAYGSWTGPSSEPALIPERLARAFGPEVLGAPAAALKVPVSCRIISEKNNMLFGASDPGSGSSQSFRPELPFWQWWTTCLRAYLERAKHPDADLGAFLGADLAEWLERGNLTLTTARWSDIPVGNRSALAEKIVYRVIGDSVLKEFGRDPRQVAEKVLLARVNAASTPKTTLMESTEMMYAIALSRDEFWME